MANRKNTCKLIKINSDYINIVTIYYFIEANVNKIAKKIENIDNIEFVRDSCFKGGYILIFILCRCVCSE